MQCSFNHDAVEYAVVLHFIQMYTLLYLGSEFTTMKLEAIFMKYINMEREKHITEKKRLVSQICNKNLTLKSQMCIRKLTLKSQICIGNFTLKITPKSFTLYC